MSAFMVEDFKGPDGAWVKSYGRHGDMFTTRSYKLWCRVRARCNPAGKFQRDKPTYVGCVIGGTFGDFQKFTDWHVNQIGYGVEGYALDKDFLFPGNKEYSESKCVLIPMQLNSFTTHKKSYKGNWPVGVQLDKSNNLFMASIYIGGKNKTLGRFDSPEQASAAYVAAKEAEALRWARRLQDGEYAVDDRVITALKQWRVYEQA